VEQERHGTEEQLEAYALGQLSDSEEQVMEEHLFICNTCRTAVDQSLIFGWGMREVLEQATPARDWLAWLRPVLVPRLAMAGTIAALLTVAGLSFATADHTRYQPIAALQLAAIRGGTPSVKPAREIRVTLNSFPTSGEPFELEVADASGRKLWSGATSSPNVAVHEKFRPGTYFVRLYGSNGALLHEYGFTVQPAAQ
jgi:hypothetical protein